MVVECTPSSGQILSSKWIIQSGLSRRKPMAKQRNYLTEFKRQGVLAHLARFDRISL
jgi:hypothetical protein